MPLPISDLLQLTTVRIRCKDSSGTGFFLDLVKGGGKAIPVLVTNKHVIDGFVEGSFTITGAKKDASGESIPDFGNHHEVSFKESDWLRHPDPDVDLAALPIATALLEARKQGNEIFRMAFTLEEIPADDEWGGFAAIEDIVMVGSPLGFWDESHNLPIIRRGCTASSVKMPFNGKNQFVIDCASFPGSSGSPVVIYNAGVFEQNGEISMGGHRVKLVGILWGGRMYDAQGTVQSVPIPTSFSQKVFARVPANLGLCVRADELFWFDEEYRRRFPPA